MKTKQNCYNQGKRVVAKEMPRIATGPHGTLHFNLQAVSGTFPPWESLGEDGGGLERRGKYWGDVGSIGETWEGWGDVGQKTAKESLLRKRRALQRSITWYSPSISKQFMFFSRSGYAGGAGTDVGRL